MEGNYGDALLGALSKVNFPQINRFSPEAFDWLFEQEKESVDLLKWLSKTLSADTYLSEDQLESYNQIPSSERLTGGKVLEEALDSLQDKDSNVSNEELERKIAELESELGYHNENCDVMGALKSQLTDSERLSSVELNQLHEQVEKVRRDNRKGQESVLEMNTDFNASLKKLENSLQEYKSKYEATSSRLSKDKVHAFQIDLDQISTKETELNQAIGSFISTVFGSKFNNLGIFQTQSDVHDDEKPKVMDLESKDLLELVRGRDRTEFQHLKSEIYRIRACLYKSEMDRIEEQSHSAGLLAALESLNQSLRLNRNTALVPISTGDSDKFGEILSCLKRNSDDKENLVISDLISRCISYYCQRVLITDYNIKYRRSAYMFKKLHSIRDELIQSRAREQLLDLMLAQEADHISNITNSFKHTQQLLDERYRKRQGFKSAVESLEVSGNASNGDCIDTKPGMVIKPDDFIFTKLHKLLRFKEHVDAVPTYAGVEQAIAPLIHHKHQILEEIYNNKENRLETVHSVEAGIRRLFSLLHIDQFSPSRGISLIPKEVNRAISSVDKDIKHLEMKLKAILTEWEQAKADIKTRSKMSSPARSTRSTPSKRGTPSAAASPAPSTRSNTSRTSRGGREVENSDLSDLAAPLPPSSPAALPSSPAGGLMGPPRSTRSPGALSELDFRGPGSVRVSEIDLSSPLSYNLGSVGSSLRTPGTDLNVRGTPLRIRSDIQSDRRIRTVNLPSQAEGTPMSQGDLPVPSSNMGSDMVPPSENSETQPRMVIWGTDVQLNECKRKFKVFIQSFQDKDVADDEEFEGLDHSMPYYDQRLQEIAITFNPFLNVNAGHIRSFDDYLYTQLIQYPQEVIPILDMAVNEIFFEKFPDTELVHQIQVLPYNAEITKNMRSLDPTDLDRLITIQGMVIRASDLIPEIVSGFFQCSVCKNTATVDVEKGRIQEPVLCGNCNTNYSFALVHNRSKFADKQLIRLQESPDDMPAGQTPHNISLFVHGDMVDKVMPGDRVTVTGIYRAVPHRNNPKMRTVVSVYKTHVDVVHFRKADSTRLRDSAGEDGMFPPERIEMLKELSKKVDIYDRLARAIAPSIYENEDIKKGILLQLLGGTRKDFTKAGRGNFRSELNILLCGDPGTSKSQLLQYVFHLVPRSQYTSGKGSSAVGLTAFITKDPDTKQLVLQTGALVLADNGICCIDEFDKMNDSTRSVLHEVMEQQTLSIAKAGIITQLNARTSILAAANPIGSEFDRRKTVTENIDLPPTLISRFDLIFLVLDPANSTYDKRLAQHLVSLYYKEQSEAAEEVFSMGILRDYIAYAKQKFRPKITDEAGEKLIDHYRTMRLIGANRKQITAYPRQLESLIRLSEAHAKMRFSNLVEMVDVEEAYRLHKEAVKQSATDPQTGLVDMELIATGMSAETKKKRHELAKALKVLLEKKGKVVNHNVVKILQEFREGSDIQVTREMFDDALKILTDERYLTRTNQTIRISAIYSS